MAYENPIVITHYGPAGVDFGTGGSSGAISFRGPAGHKGRLIDVGVANITEAFAGDTTDGQLLVGTDADTDAYALLNVAAGATSAIGDTFNAALDSDAIISANIPADAQIEVTAVVGTGGTPAGIGTPYVVVGWYK
jgi:hypothetical protein